MGENQSNQLEEVYVHPTAIIESNVSIGRGTKVWAFVQIAQGAVIGENCVIGNGAYIDRHVKIGNNVKIHNKALLYQGVVIEDNCFIGPGVCFTNDKNPAFDKTRDMTGVVWYVRKGTTIGANVTVLPDVELGANVFVGAGSVVTKSLPANVKVSGNPAREMKG